MTSFSGRPIPVLSRAVCVVFLASVSACYPKTAPPPATASPRGVAWAEQRWPNANASSLEAGRQTFLASCSRCHDYPDLLAVDDEAWPDIVDRMGDKAELDAAKKKSVLQFILASKQP